MASLSDNDDVAFSLRRLTIMPKNEKLFQKKSFEREISIIHSTECLSYNFFVCLFHIQYYNYNIFLFPGNDVWNNTHGQWKYLMKILVCSDNHSHITALSMWLRFLSKGKKTINFSSLSKLLTNELCSVEKNWKIVWFISKLRTLGFCNWNYERDTDLWMLLDFLIWWELNCKIDG